MKRKQFRRPTLSGFTLIELLCVVVIVALLVQLAAPAYQRVMEKARSAACGSNLRQLGLAAEMASHDNEGQYPYIENDPQNPVYTAENLPEGAEPVTLLEALKDYGITESFLKCSADIGRNNRFKSMGSSYEWRPMLDGESVLAPMFYGRRGVRKVSPSRFRLMIDVDPVHRGRQNAVYADGHVRTY